MAICYAYKWSKSDLLELTTEEYEAAIHVANKAAKDGRS
jgi:hypothetical protein